MDSMLDVFTQMPLFRGVTRERMAQTVGMTKFHFLKYRPSETIVNAGDRCMHLRFILSGRVRVSITSPDGRFRVSQTLAGPDVISPDFLFGSSTLYPGDVVSIDDVSIVQVLKSDYVKILGSDPIFLFNYLNYLSMNAQKSIDGVMSLSMGSVEERIALWVVATTQPTATDVTVECKQRDMCSIFGVQRSSFVAALDRLAERGALSYTGGEICVLDRRALVSVLRRGLE